MQSLLIHKFHIEPIFKSEPLFSGEIYIEDSTWALTAVDLEMDKEAIQFCRDFKIIQNFIMVHLVVVS